MDARRSTCLAAAAITALVAAGCGGDEDGTGIPQSGERETTTTTEATTTTGAGAAESLHILVTDDDGSPPSPS